MLFSNFSWFTKKEDNAKKNLTRLYIEAWSEITLPTQHAI